MSKSRDIADSAATINYIDGLTSDAQSQLDDKATLDASPTFTGTVTATAFSGDGSGLTGVDSLPSQTGNADKFLTTDGSTASWAEAGGGAFTFISSVSMSAASTVDFTNLPLGTYDNFFIIGTGIGTSNDYQNILGRMFRNNSLSTGGDYLAGRITAAGTSSLSYSSQYTSFWDIFNNGAQLNNKGTFKLWLTNMNDAEPRNFNGYSQFYIGYGANPSSSSMTQQSTNLICGNTGTGSFDGFRLYVPSGTFVSGEIHLYGFKTSQE